MLKNKKLIIALSIIPQYFLVKLLSLFPEFIEDYYSKGIYVFTSKLFRYILGWIPFSLGDVVYILAMIYAVRWLYKHRKQFVKNTKSWFIDAFAVISIFYFAFHMLWGMNYYRLPLHKSLNLDADYTSEQLVTVTKQLITKSNKIHLQITNNDSLKVVIPYSKTEILKQVPSGYEALKSNFSHLKYQPKSIKTSLFGTPLTYMGFSGYLNPLTNEAQIDGKIPAYKFPTTASHEVAHQLGYAAENEANFVGCMAAISHDNIYFKYSGYTFALRHCLNEIYRRDEALYNEIVESVNPGILKNYKEVRDFWEHYQNPLEPLFKTTFNAFLKANNQEKGMESYSYVVALLVNYFESNSL